MHKNNMSAVLAMNLIIFILGMVLLTQFYSLLFHHVFTMNGWNHFLNELTTYNKSNTIQYQIIILLKNTAPFSMVFFALGLLILSTACFFLLARFYTCIAIAIGFSIAWALNWNDSGMWPFEFTFPIIFAVLAGFSMRRYSTFSQSIFLHLNYSVITTILLNVLITIALFYVTYIAFKDHHVAMKVAGYSSISFFLLSLAAYFLGQRNMEYDELDRVDSYLDAMTVVIGAMLILQVYINYFSGIFEPANFRENITYFAHNTNATWLSQLLILSGVYSTFILPIYIVFEILLSLFLTLLLARGPALLAAGVLLGVLAFSELGVSATWPPNPDNLSWQWELLLVTIVAFIIGIQKCLQLKDEFLQGKLSLRKIIFGNPLAKYKSISFLSALFIALFCGTGLYFIGLSAHYFIGDNYRITAIYSGITFGVLLFILLITNQFRK